MGAPDHQTAPRQKTREGRSRFGDEMTKETMSANGLRNEKPLDAMKRVDKNANEMIARKRLQIRRTRG